MFKSTIFTMLLLAALSASAQKISPSESQLYFFKVWNYTKYYHPTVASGEINADTLFLNNVAEAGKIKTRKGFNNFIRAFFAQLPKTVHRDNKTESKGKLLTQNRDNSWFTAGKLFDADNKKRLITVFENRFTDSIHHYIPDIHFNAEIPNEPEYAFPADQNLPYPLRMLAMAKLQGAVDYLFPHKYMMDQNFDRLLLSKLPLVTACKTRAEYEFILLELVASFDDTHAFKFVSQVRNRAKVLRNTFYPPFKYAVFDDRIVVLDIILPELCAKSGIEVGDIILKVNNETVASLVTKTAKKLSVSNKPTLRYFLSDYVKNLAWQSDAASFTLTVEKKGSTAIKTVDFIPNTDKQNIERITDYIKNSLPEHRTDRGLDIIDGNIAHFKIREVARLYESVADDKIEATIDSLFTIAGKQKGIIIDMRAYPDWGGFVAYTLKKFGTLPNRYADYYEVNKKEIGTYILNNNPDTYNNPNITTGGEPYKGKVVLIVNPATISQSEWNTMNLQHVFPQSITIGEQSAGADGDEKMLMLPGGYKVNFTGNAIFYHNGANAQRKGVRIDKFLPLTPENVLQKDYLLDEALQLIKS